MTMTTKEFNGAVKEVKTAGELFDLLWKAGAEFNEAEFTTLCKREEEVKLREVSDEEGTAVWAKLPRIKFVRKKDIPNYIDYTPLEMEIRDYKIHQYKPILEAVDITEWVDDDIDDLWEGDDE